MSEKFATNHSKKKSIAVLGSTGSIGQNTLKVAEHLSSSITVTALSAHSNISLLEKQIAQFKPKVVAVSDEKSAAALKRASLPVKILSGEQGLEEIAIREDVDFVVVGIVGMAALKPTIAALNAGKGVGVANKEVFVSAGEFITTLMKRCNATLIPIDSEHSGLFQLLRMQEKRELRRLILTASGGPFRLWDQERLAKVTIKDALTHPIWSMGVKNTIDSSTLMNKALEVIEARWLFGVSPEKIDVVIHPQSIIHSMVEWIDGTLFAQMSDPYMIYPIQYALTYPKRAPATLPSFDFASARSLDFSPPDLCKFPALTLAYEALRQGGSLPCYLNAANEVLVNRFVQGEISWQAITNLLQKLMEKHRVIKTNTIEETLAVDQLAREEAKVYTS